MASEGVEKPAAGSGHGISDVAKATTKRDGILLGLRVVAFLATASATLVMALNRETKTFVVGSVGSTPITATLKARFHDAPANVYAPIAHSAHILNLSFFFFFFKI